MMEDPQRPQASRRSYQAALARRRRIQRKRRLARARRIQFWKGVRSIRFWSRTLLFTTGLLTIAFWAKFAFVYDIPEYAHRGAISNVSMYVTVKPWWFGPPVFDLGDYGVSSDAAVIVKPYGLLLDKLGRYGAVVESPQFVWVEKR